MKEGDVVITALPQSDGRKKNRPVIVLRVIPPFDDLLVCGVSSELRHYVRGFDQIIRPADTDFGASGLLRVSLIRLGYLIVVPRTTVAGTIGSIASERHKRLLRTLSSYLTRDI